VYEYEFALAKFELVGNVAEEEGNAEREVDNIQVAVDRDDGL